MGFLVLLKFAVKCFDLLAWPLIALGYPLCASIRAIESDSNEDIRKLVNYWVLFTLISLFDHAFGRLLEWLPFWAYVKLIGILWLVVPRFDGSFYAYENLVRPCFSVSPYAVIQRCNKRKEELLVNGENFLAAAERYVQENGPEALERLIASKCSNPNVDVEEIKAIATTEKKEVDQCSKPNIDVKEIKAVAAREKEVDQCKESDAVHNKSKAMEVTEKRELGAEVECKKSSVAQKETRAVEETEKKDGTAANWVNQAAPSLAQTENQTFSAAGTKSKATSTGSDSKLPETPSSSNVQKEWTCALCQVRTTNENVLNYHLQGKKHKAAIEKLKANNQTAENKSSPASSTPKKSDQPNVEKKTRKNMGKQEEKVAGLGKQTNPNKTSQGELWCYICNIKCPGQPQMDSHVKGKKHLAQIQKLNDSA